MKGYKCKSCGAIVPIGEVLVPGYEVVCATCGGDAEVVIIHNEDGLTYSRSDIMYFNNLFPEEGPGKCLKEGCPRKRTRDSVFCAPHEFQFARNKPCPWVAPQKIPALLESYLRFNN